MTTSLPDWNNDPSLVADPYPAYRQLFAEGRTLYWDDKTDAYTVMGYHDVAGMLKDSRFLTNRMKVFLPRLDEGTRTRIQPLIDTLGHFMIYLDPPEHGRLRTPVVKAFDTRVVKNWRSRIEQVTARLMDAMTGQEVIDVVPSLAFPLPITMISEMLGLPAGDAAQLKAWTNDVAAFIDRTTHPDVARNALQSVASFRAYFSQAIAERRDAPREDLLSYLLQLRAEHPDISDDDIIGNAVLILAAGHETTTALIGNTLLALARHPDALARLREHPELIESCIDESLRFDPPIHRTGRLVSEALEWNGMALEKDKRVSVFLAAANRDPRVFQNPDRFDIERKPEAKQLSFGFGPHYCAGSGLGRTEAIVAVSEFVKRFPHFELAADPVYVNNLTLRCPGSIKLRITSG
jgi:pimeloyl-[acyl-carrier protein] synthase